MNVAAILAGSAAGTLVGGKLPGKMRETVMDGLGLATMMIGVKMVLGTSNILYVIGSILLGGIVGEWLDIDRAITMLGQKMERVVMRIVGGDKGGSDGRFARGFVAATLLFCVGPMAILGSIQDGLTGDYSTLAVKSLLDGFASLAFASGLGLGVAFSSLSVFVYQGIFTIGAGLLQGVLSSQMIAELTATGGVLIFAIGLGLLEIKKVRVANLLPAVVFAPLLTYIVSVVS